jgi:ankyrin repeat protein
MCLPEEYLGKPCNKRKRRLNLATWDEQIRMVSNDEHIQLQEEIKSDPHLISKVNEMDSTLFILAASRDSYECTKTLIYAGSDINKKNKEGRTALISAVLMSNLKISRFLLVQGAEVSLRNNKGLSAFDLAMQDHLNDIRVWFRVFAPYKDQFDSKDLALYYESRLPALFV